jgi:hypothetical protein
MENALEEEARKRLEPVREERDAHGTPEYPEC